MRAGDSKLRPMHLMCHPFPRPQRGSRVSAPNVVIGIGNRFRRDDGSALQVLNALAGRLPESTVVIESDGEPARLIDSWGDAPMPLKLRLIGIEPEDLGWGEGLTAAVAHSIDAAADLVLDYLGLSASASAFRSSR